MAFMKPIVEYMAMYHVETNMGTEYVPEEVCGPIDLEGDGNDGEELLAYLEGRRIQGVERRTGWYGRLSAPGYLDCTDWQGPYPTTEEALDSIKEQYECDNNGDDLES